MRVTATPLDGCFVIEPELIEDERGYFFESFHREKFRAATRVNAIFVQDNQSASKYGVLRGLHMQNRDCAQAKLVRALSGKILDVAVDLRPDSKTYARYFSIELSGENRKQLFIPRGFAHGFVTLSEGAEVFYKCDDYYDRDSETGIRYDDPQLNIDWQIQRDAITLSKRDAARQSLSEWESGVH